jgi:hypothetical protein
LLFTDSLESSKTQQKIGKSSARGQEVKEMRSEMRRNNLNEKGRETSIEEGCSGY